MTTLTDFLLARIAEDEVVARDAWGATWQTQYGVVVWSAQKVEGGYPLITEGCSEFNGKHMARHDPARVLAECEAKRQIVDMHDADWCRSCSGRVYDGHGPCDTLMALALPYADHSEFREEWRV